MRGWYGGCLRAAKKKKRAFDKLSDNVKTGNKRKKSGQFEKGGKGGPGRKAGVKVLVMRCHDFMTKQGWKELEWYALNRANPKVAVEALKTIAAYGFGRPPELVELIGGGEAMTIADFFDQGEKAKAKS